MKEFVLEISAAVLIFGMLSASADNGATEPQPLDFGVDPVLVEESFARADASRSEIPFPAPAPQRG